VTMLLAATGYERRDFGPVEKRVVMQPAMSKKRVLIFIVAYNAGADDPERDPTNSPRAC